MYRFKNKTAVRCIVGYPMSEPVGETAYSSTAGMVTEGKALGACATDFPITWKQHSNSANIEGIGGCSKIEPRLSTLAQINEPHFGHSS